MSECDNHVLWSGRPAQGLAWRPQDFGHTATYTLVGAVVLFMSIKGEHWFFFALSLAVLAYVLVGRFYHDAALRKRISYMLTQRGLEVWRDGKARPECLIDLHRLNNLQPLFITNLGRGTVELPPGGWARQPEWFDRWDSMVPAMYPCRRLELLDDVLPTLETIRREASLTRFGHLKPSISPT